MANLEAASVGWSRTRRILDTLATLSVIVAATAVTSLAIRSYVNEVPRAGAPASSVVPVPKEPQKIENAVVVGSDSARVVLIAYSDFQCPYCAGFARDTLPALRTEYFDKKKVKMVFKHLPLPFHSRARRAAEAAECAARQGRFLEMHDRLFDRPSELSEAGLVSLANEAGLDRSTFERCMGGETSAIVESNAADARALSIVGTPTFLLGQVQKDGRVAVKLVLTGAQPVEAFRKAINALL